MNVYIGIDIGTTNIKASIFDIDGNQLAYHAVSNVVLHPLQEWSEFEPDAVWRKVLSCLKNSRAQLSGAWTVRAIGVASLGESGILLDEQGKTLTNFVAWYDQRSKKEFDALLHRIDAENIFRITGQIPSEKYGLSKIMWQKTYAPEAYKHAAHWLSMEDFIIYRLTGVYATDYSIASRTMAFDIRTLEWSEVMADAAEVDIRLFPKAYPGGTAIGTILKEVADQTGVNPEAMVSTGGHDHACAAVAVNIFETGTVLDSMGTAEVSMIGAENLPDPDGAEFSVLYKNQYSIYPHCGPKPYRILTSNQSCGICLEWLIQRVLEPGSSENATDKYDTLLKEAEHAVLKDDSIMFLPFLRGAVENTAMRGLFWQINDQVGQKEVTASVVEGLCLEFRYHIMGYEEALRRPISRIRAVGGLCRSEFIMNTKSRVLGMAVEVPVCKDAACYGAALLGKIAVGDGSWDRMEEQLNIGNVYNKTRSTNSQIRYKKYHMMREQLKNISV